MENEILTILLPGLDGTGRLLSAFASAAPRGFKPVVLSYPVDRELGYDELEHYLLGVLPQRDNLLLVAESFGGPLAIRLSSRSDLSVRAVVLCNSFVTAPSPRALRHLARTPLFRVRLPQPILAALMLAPFATPQLTAEFANVIGAVPANVVAHRVRQLLEVDVRDRLESLRDTPILYLRGTHDRLVSQRAVGELLNAAPHTVVANLAAPHAALQTAPTEAWADIERFLSRTAP